MKNRLRRQEKDAIKDLYSEELIFNVLVVPCKALEGQMDHFRYAMEELYADAMTLIDDIKEKPLKVRQKMHGLWDILYCNFRDLSTSATTDEELTMATAELLYAVALLLHVGDDSCHCALAATLMLQVDKHRPDLTERLDALFLPAVYRCGEEELSAAVRHCRKPLRRATGRTMPKNRGQRAN